MAEPESYKNLLGCPADRLGAALRSQRLKAGLSLAHIARTVDYAFTPVVLELIEAGLYPLDDTQVLILVWGYEADPDQLLPSRDALVLDTEKRQLGAGLTVEELRRTATAPGLLYEYMQFVYKMRGKEPGTTVPLREADLAVLAQTIDWPMVEVREHLTTLMSCWDDAIPDEIHSVSRQSRSNVFGAAVPVGLIQRFEQYGESRQPA